MSIRRLTASLGVVVFVFAACSTPAATTAPTTAPSTAASVAPSEAASVAPSEAATGCTVGVSWNNFQEPRWAKFDKPAIQAAVEAGGGTYLDNDAKSSAETQASNVENLISQGANVLIILAQDGTAIKPSVASALSQGIPVVAYDRLIEDPGALYITFDNQGVGKLMAEYMLELVPEGNYAIIKGNSADANADFLRAGMTEAGIPDVGKTDPSGKIVIVDERYTDNWDPKNAQITLLLSAGCSNVSQCALKHAGGAPGPFRATVAKGLS